MDGESARPPSGLVALRTALGGRARLSGGSGSNLVVPLRGGAAALLGPAASRRLITTVTEDDVHRPVTGITAWLEKRQARRSALLVVPDRPTGVAIALRWKISPERFRLASSFQGEVRETAVSASGARRPWHSRG
jgi:hypothetical protein